MKKKYITPRTLVLKMGTEEYVLEYDVIGGSKGTSDGWSKYRTISEDNDYDQDLWD